LRADFEILVERQFRRVGLAGLRLLFQPKPVFYSLTCRRTRQPFEACRISPADSSVQPNIFPVEPVALGPIGIIAGRTSDAQKIA
jgi:hypothetical protein